MDLSVLLLRLVHIGGGIFWVGAALLMVYYVAPTAAAAGPEGERFTARLIARGAVKAVSLASLTTIISGILLYWRSSGYLQPEWIFSPPGLALTIGSLAGLGSLVLAVSTIEPMVKRLGILGADMAVAGGPPVESQRIKLADLQRRLTAVARADAYLLIISVIGIAIARSL